jgi:hypothetical protein
MENMEVTAFELNNLVFSLECIKAYDTISTFVEQDVPKWHTFHLLKGIDTVLVSLRVLFLHVLD